MPSPYGIPEATTKELVGKTFDEIVDHLYAEVEKCSDGDIANVRTLLVSLFAASIIGLSDEETAEQLQRAIRLLKVKLKVVKDES
jgi:hypothetical protein